MKLMKKVNLGLIAMAICAGLATNHHVHAGSDAFNGALTGAAVGGLAGGRRGAGIGAGVGFLAGALSDRNRNSNSDPVENQLNRLSKDKRNLNKKLETAIKKNNTDQIKFYKDRLRQTQDEINQLSGRSNRNQ